jgi:hypothetical protein
MNARLSVDRVGETALVSVFIVFLAASAFAQNPIPSITGLVHPSAVAQGSGAFTLTVYGARFVSGAVVNWKGSPRSTTFVSARELQAQILASDVTTPTGALITVTNPPPGGGVSSSSYGLVEVHAPISKIVLKNPHFYFPNESPLSLMAADFNGDGILDLLAPAPTGDRLRLALGNPDGTFRFGGNTGANYFGAGGIGYGDFNGDGKLDIIFGSGSPDNPPTHLTVLG